jgi:hypothetical protein
VLKGFWRWLQIVGFMVALMSGALSLARELYLIYNPHAMHPANLFWHCVWIAFISSSVIAWVAEYRRAESFKNELATAKARPYFTGHLYQFNIHPRVGIMPPKMAQEALDIFAKTRGQTKTEYKVDCDVFIEAYIVNERLSVGNILEYELAIDVEGQVVKLKSEPGFGGWIHIRSSYRIDAVTGRKVEDPIRQEEVPDLMSLTARPMPQGHGVEGWLHFVLENVNPIRLETTPAKLKLPNPLKAVDGYGTEHPIVKGWEGKRETGIAPNVHSN